MEINFRNIRAKFAMWVYIKTSESKLNEKSNPPAQLGDWTFHSVWNYHFCIGVFIELTLNYEYVYDGNGNCIKKSGQRYQNEYTYDKKNQLKTASYNGRWETYTYDKVGNRIQKETKEGTKFYTYNTKNQLTSIKTNTGRTDFHYDTQGNLREELGIEKKQYFYDTLNRLSTVKTNQLLQNHRYDAERLRHEVEENGVVSRFIFDNGELSAEETKDSKVCYLYGKERVVASKINGAETGYHIQDEAGSTLFLLDETHKIQKTYHYDAFGMILEESGDTLNRLTYTGQQYDTATGQYYLRARFYNPALGRFLQEDVYRGDGLNLYAYCRNHPVGYYDPSGYMGCPTGPAKTNSGKKSGSTSVTVGDNNQSIVYRVIRSDENPMSGLTAKNPTRGMSIEGHIVSGSRNKGSQFISTTTDINVANKYSLQDGCRIVEIDLNKLPRNVNVYDLSTITGRNTYLKGVTAKNFAAKSSEVLLEGYIPSDAISLR